MSNLLQNEQEIMESPFEFGREFGAKELDHRIDELATVRQSMKTGGKLFAIVPQQFIAWAGGVPRRIIQLFCKAKNFGNVL